MCLNTFNDNPVKKIFLVPASFCLFLLMAPSASFAASIDIINGGIGQVSSNPQQFGVAVCNEGDETLTSALPITVTVADQTVTTSSTAPIDAGQCLYTYLDYSQFNMQPSQTYSVDVVIDPQHTVVSNTNNEATYSVIAPSQLAVAKNINLMADAVGILSAPFAAFWNFILSLASRL